MNLYTPLLRDALAAEYVLGTLQGLARRRFERLLPAHPALQRAVADWERRLNRLAATSPPVSPAPQIWSVIEQRLFPAPPHRPWWDNLSFWRGLALAGVLMAVIAIAPHWPLSPDETTSAVAMIRSKHQEVLWTVALADNGQLHVSNLRAMDMPPDQRCLLWLKTSDAPPVLLGVLPDDGGMRSLPMPSETTRPAQGELWVTMQPMVPNPQPPRQPLYHTHWQAL